jgi:glycosyltransferase involved in cell wall biosynthesis
LKDLLNALPKIRTQLKEVILIVAGEFWENKTSYQMMIEELGIADSIILDDRYIPNEDVPFYFSAADVLVAPYHRATGSGAVQMANGFGVGVVTTFGCEAKTEMKKNIVTPPNDPEALAKAILHFFQEDRSIKSQDAPNNQDQLSWDFLADYLQGSHSTPSGVQKTDKDGQ